MVLHIQRCHKAEYDNYLLDKESQSRSTPVMQQNLNKSEKQQTLTSLFQKKTVLPSTSKEAKTITDLTARMLTTSFLPYRFVEEQGFRDLIHYLKPNYQVPSSTTFSRSVIPELYTTEKEKLKISLVEDMNEVKSISLTTDSWVSKATHSYTSLTCHYAKKFEYKSYILGNVMTEEKHTAVNIRQLLSTKTAEWEIPGPEQSDGRIKVYIVTDNARNFTAAFENTNWTHRQCFAHTLQLAIKDGKNQSDHVDEVIAKGRTIVSHYSRSAIASARLRQACEDKGLPSLKLIQHVDTRWCSELAMLERLLSLKEAVVSELAMSNADVECFTNSEWKLVEAVVSILKPFSDATEESCSDTYPTSSMIIPIIHCLEVTLVRYVTKNTFDAGVQFARNLHKTLKSRFPMYKSDRVNALCTLVDPRFKDVFFQEEVAREHGLQLLKRECEACLSSQSTMCEVEQHAPDHSPSSSLWSALDKLVENHVPRKTVGATMTEIENYLSFPHIPRTSCPYKWWKENKHLYPTIASVATEYLPIPATQVASERLFSVSGNIVTSRRELLRPDHVEQLTFLHDKFKKHL